MSKRFLKKNIPFLFRLLKQFKGTDYDFLLNLPKIEEKDYDGQILSDEKGNQLIYELLVNDQPCLICRFGSAELSAVMNHLFIEEGKIASWSFDRINKGLFRMDAVFPANEQTLNRFCSLYLKDIKGIDALAIWYNYGEQLLHKTHFPKALLFPIQSLEPFRFQAPWSSALAGKKVLVVLPFQESVKKQYENRHLLFENKDVLPTCDLIIYRPFNSYTDESATDCDWFWYLENMKEQIAAIEFDIALIAAGPFGLPLAAAIKNMGKKAIHVGGALQLLFGIKGSRWEERPEFAAFMNEYWIKPSGAEVPVQKVKTSIDNSSYW
jgi:hypothetical protein